MGRFSRRDFLWVLGLAGAGTILAGCTLGQRPPSEQVCTLIGCGPSLEVALVGEHVPTDFSVTVDSPSGEFVNVLCTEGNARFDPPEAARWTPACPAGGVTFQGFTPAQIKVSVRWSEAQVAQDFEPVYSEGRPNGPHCEPTCRSARVLVRIPEVPAYGDPSTWQTYTDEEHGFRIKYPPALPLELGASVDGYRTVFVGDQIRVQTSPRDPLVCQGECPMIENSEAMKIAGREARQVRGYIGSIGGNVPQYFMLYLFRLGDVHVSFVLYAESRYAIAGDPSVISPLKEADIDLFERMMQTLEFTSPGP